METMLLPLALAALLIFFLFNSRRKQKARMEQIKTGLVPGAKVMTTFGVFGTVVSIDDDENQVLIESGPGTTLRVHRQAIGQIESPETPAAAGPVDVAAADTTDKADENPAITDAELDAMNERKRAESDDADAATTDAAATDAAKADTTKADTAEADDIESIAKSDAASAEAAGADDAAAKTDAEAAAGSDSAVEGLDTDAAPAADAASEDSAKGLDTETPDSDEKKN